MPLVSNTCMFHYCFQHTSDLQKELNVDHTYHWYKKCSPKWAKFMKIVIFPIGTKCDLQNELIWTIYLPLVKKDISKMDQIKKKILVQNVISNWTKSDPYFPL